MNTKSPAFEAQSFRSTAFPTAEDMKQWHSLSPQEHEAVLIADVQEGLDGPASKRQSKDEIIKAALAAYVDAV